MDTVTVAAKPWAGLSYQRAFDIMLDHLRLQGQPAATPKGGCRYRFEGLKCAVGAIIPDSKYRPDFDVDESLEDITRQLGGSPEFCEFLRDCRQYMHDAPAKSVHLGYEGTFLDHVESGAAKVARKHNLQYRQPAGTKVLI